MQNVFFIFWNTPYYCLFYSRGLDKYNEMYNESIDAPAKFWKKIADKFYWKKPPPQGSKVKSEDIIRVAESVAALQRRWEEGGPPP